MKDRARAYNAVADRIREWIHDGRLEAGARLPAERNLATLLGVSRTLLREALFALELGGEIEVHGGSGAYVRAPARVSRAAGPGPYEVLGVRHLLEPEVAATAARVATDNTIDALLAATTRAVSSAGGQAQECLDREFHQALARATGNSALVSVMEYLWSLPCTRAAQGQPVDDTDMQERTQADHRRIVQAIAAHDPPAASRAMREHLKYETRLLSQQRLA